MKAYKTTPKHYLQMLKYDHAKKLVESETYTVHEIASICGFEDDCSFSRFFKTMSGSSPSFYTKH